MTASLPISRLLILVGLLIGLGANASAVDLSGRAFAITISADGGTQQDRLMFTAKDLTCKALGGQKLPYKASEGKNKKIEFEATSTDAAGNVVAVKGSINRDNITGTIEMTPKGGALKSLSFSGLDKANAK